jgi:hypothetical protein
MTLATTTTNYLQKIQKWGREEQEVQKITTLQKNKIILQISNSNNFFKIVIIRIKIKMPENQCCQQSSCIQNPKNGFV